MPLVPPGILPADFRQSNLLIRDKFQIARRISPQIVLTVYTILENSLQRLLRRENGAIRKRFRSIFFSVTLLILFHPNARDNFLQFRFVQSRYIRIKKYLFTVKRIRVTGPAPQSVRPISPRPPIHLLHLRVNARDKQQLTRHPETTLKLSPTTFSSSSWLESPPRSSIADGSV